MKTNISYYQHETDCHNTPGFKVLKNRYGFAGHGKYFMLCNIIANSHECKLDLSVNLYRNSIAADLEFTTDEFNEFIRFLSEDCLLLLKEDDIITTELIQENYNTVMDERLAAKKRYKKSKITQEEGSDKNSRQNNAENSYKVNKSKVKEIKENKTKVNESEVNVCSTQEDSLSLSNEKKHELQIWIKQNCPNISGLKTQMSYSDCVNAVNSYSLEEIQDVLRQMENYKLLRKKYVNTYLTLINWIKLSKEKFNVESNTNKRRNDRQVPRGYIDKDQCMQELAEAYS